MLRSAPKAPQLSYCLVQESTKQVPFIGTIATLFGAIYVPRAAADGSSSAKASTAAMISARQRAHPYPATNVPPLIVFPEGTTNNGLFLTHFHPGAFRAGQPVQPVLLEYPHEHFSPAFESITPFYYLWRVLTQLHNRVRVTVLDVYEPNMAERRDAALFARNVRDTMAAALGVQCSESTFRDKLELHAAIRARGLDWAAGHDVLSDQLKDLLTAREKRD